MKDCRNNFYLVRVDNCVNEYYDKIGNIYKYYETLYDKLKFNFLEFNILTNMVFKIFLEPITPEFFNEIQDLYKKIDLSVLRKALVETKLGNKHYDISTSPRGKYIKIPVSDFVNRPPTKMIDKIMVSLKNAPIHRFFNVGNQLTTFSNALIDRFKDLDGIEVFGSAYNTRLRRYGCMFPEVERAFGAIGKAEDIFKGILDKTITFPGSKYGRGGLLISPPSARELHDLALSYTKRILEAIKRGELEPIEIVLAISSTKKSIFDFYELNKIYTKQIEVTHGFYFKCMGKGKFELVSVKLKENWIEYYF
jgi:hypothetical protein